MVALRHDGSLIWKMDLQDQFGNFEDKFGLSASLLQHGQHLFVLLDHEGESSLVSLKKTDGSLRWKSDRGSRERSWSSPAIIHLDEQSVIVCSSPGTIGAYEIETGNMLAEFKDVGGNSVATPVDFGDGRFLVASLIRPADGPSRGALRSNMMLQLEEADGKYRFRRIWVAEDARGSFASPILHQSECYFINPIGVVYCVDAETGQQHYAKRLSCGGCWATPIACGDHIYFFGRDGRTTILRSGATFEVVTEDNLLKPEVTDDDDQEDPPAGLARNSRPSLYATVVTEEGLLFRFGTTMYLVSKWDDR